MRGIILFGISECELSRMAPEGLARGDIACAGTRPDERRALPGQRRALCRRTIVQQGAHLVQRPAQIDRRRPCRQQHLCGPVQRLVGCIRTQRQPKPIGRRRPDQRGPAHLHGDDRPRRIIKEMANLASFEELKRKARLGLLLARDVYGNRNRPAPAPKTLHG